MSYMAAADIIIINIINIIINVPDSLCSLSPPFFKTCGRCGVLNDVFCETSCLCVNHTHYTRHLNKLFCLNTLKNSRPQTREPMLWKFQLHFCVLGLIPSLHNILEALLFNPFIKSIKKKKRKKKKAGKKYLGQCAVKGQRWSIRPSSGPGSNPAYSGCRLTAPSQFFSSGDLSSPRQVYGSGLWGSNCPLPLPRQTSVLCVSPRGEAHCVYHLLRHTLTQKGWHGVRGGSWCAMPV